jgi:hypothetical protein
MAALLSYLRSGEEAVQTAGTGADGPVTPLPVQANGQFP